MFYKTLFAFTFLFIIVSTKIHSQNTENSKSTIYFYRTHVVGAALKYRYYDGEKNIGKSSFEEVIKYECDPGEHHFGVLLKNATEVYKPEFLTVDVKLGKEYFIKAKLKKKQKFNEVSLRAKVLKRVSVNGAKKGNIYLENLSTSREIIKDKGKIFKKAPLVFLDEKLNEDEKEFEEIVSSEYKEFIGGANRLKLNETITKSNASITIKELTEESDYDKLTIEQLKQVRKNAIEEENPFLARAIKEKITEKEKAENTSVTLDNKELPLLNETINNANSGVALKNASLLGASSFNNELTEESDYDKLTIEQLKQVRKNAIEEENPFLARAIKEKITESEKAENTSITIGNKEVALLNETGKNANSSVALKKTSLLGEASFSNELNEEGDYDKLTIEQLRQVRKNAIEEENPFLARAIKEKITEREKTENTSVTLDDKDAEDVVLVNKRQIALEEILSKVNLTNSISSTNYKEVNTSDIVEPTLDKLKIKKEGKNNTKKGIKYRRSSLYTLMIKDDGRDNSKMIKNTFGNFELPDKFNNHNIGPYLIDIDKGIKDQSYNISNYLNTNSIAKKLVSKWFNRSEKGGFNMNLIAERGTYNASDLDIKLASNKERGMALLEDAGEELIKNTFVIINDYKFTNKEKVAKKAGGFLKTIANISSATGLGDVSDVSTLVSTGIEVVGKGYVIKTTAYLYKLIWNEGVAATFYNDYWTEDDSIDTLKKIAFEESNLFKLELIGSQSAFADLQSTIFTEKSDEGLIEIATVKATDKSIAKLERQYEEFRTKSPLLSGDPITAKIGLKEGVEKGDKFEVLEQVINKQGKTAYKRVGIIKVDKSQIWDNRYKAKEVNEGAGIEYTTFTGAKNKYYSGMLIRQIN